MSTVLGIDAGGSKTVAAIVNETGGVLSLIVSAGLDPTRAEDAESELDGFLSGFVSMDAVPFEAATIGLPFHEEITAITAMQKACVAKVFGNNARVRNDVEVAHIGAFAGGEGVLVLAGTGSMAWARGPAGTARAGGFGDLIGDEGSAFWIGQRALALLSQEADGRRPTSSFGNAVLAALGIGSDGLIEWVYGQRNPRSGIASIARHISGLAVSGDAAAVSILKSAAVELAVTAFAAARAAGLAAPFPLSTAGSVFRDPTLRAELALLTGTVPVSATLPPVGGAVLDAALRAGWAVDQSWISRLGGELNQQGAP